MTKVILAGASGLIGSALVPFLQAGGFTVIPLKRPQDYDPEGMTIRRGCLEGADIIINLAGENVAQRWSKKVREKIKSSRVNATRLLCEEIVRQSSSPSLLLNASAIGFYGNRSEQTLDESASSGTGFLADVVQEWEKQLRIAEPKVARVVALRLGVVISPKGGAFKQMLTSFRWGLGGVMGDGKQYISWIALDDVLGAIHHIILHPEIHGPVNCVAPHPVRNKELTQMLSQALHRPAFFSVPAKAIRWLMGEIGEELLLSSTKAEPKKLLETGYPFLYPDLEKALKHYIRD